MWGHTPDAGTQAYPGRPAENIGGESPAVGSPARDPGTPRPAPARLKRFSLLHVEMPNNPFASAYAAIKLDRDIKKYKHHLAGLIVELERADTAVWKRSIRVKIERAETSLRLMRSKRDGVPPSELEDSEKEDSDVEGDPEEPEN